MTTMCPSFSRSAVLVGFADPAVRADRCVDASCPSSREHAKSSATASTANLQLLPARENMLTNPGSIRRFEEMRSIEIEREHDVAPNRRQRLRQADAGGDTGS